MNNKHKIIITTLIAVLIVALIAVWLGLETIGYARLGSQAKPAKPAATDAAEWMDGARRQLGLADTVYLLSAVSSEVTGDSTIDAVLLVGVKTAAEDLFAQNIDIIVRDGKSGRFFSAGLTDFSGYESSLFTGDFTGDKVNDVMVTAASGGSGGIVNHAIVAFAGSVPSVVFSSKDNTGAAFSGRFLDGFEAELINDNTGLMTRVDIASAKARHIENGIYRADGKLLKPVTPYAYPFGRLEPVDLNHDGTYELKGAQKIVGAYNADIVAYAYSYWQYDSSQSWQLRQLEVSSLLLGLNQENRPANTHTGQAVAKQMKSQHASVSYPQFETMQDQAARDYVNTTLEAAARELINSGTSDSPVAVDYEIAQNDTKILSVVFKAGQSLEGTASILHTVNIDLKNQTLLSMENLFRSDPYSRRSIDALITAAAEQAGAGIPDLSEWTGMYITSQDIVLYRENHQEPEQPQLHLPLAKVQAYLNEPFAAE